MRAIGVSNLTLEQLDEAARAGPIAALQNEYSLLERSPERELLPRCVELGIGFVPYYPLAAGLLTGKYRHGGLPPQGTRWAGEEAMTEGTWVSPQVEASAATFALVDRLGEYARARGHSLLELAIAGLASRPGVASVIAGATSPAQVRGERGRRRLAADRRRAEEIPAGNTAPKGSDPFGAPGPSRLVGGGALRRAHPGGQRAQQHHRHLRVCRPPPSGTPCAPAASRAPRVGLDRGGARRAVEQRHLAEPSPGFSRTARLPGGFTSTVPSRMT